MKNLKFIFGVLMCTALFTACSSDDDNKGEGPDPLPPGEDPFLSVDEKAIPLTYVAKDFLVDVKTNLKTLDVAVEMKEQADVMWFSAKYSAKAKQLKVSATENRVKEARTATITLTAAGVDPVVITVTQEASPIEHDPFEVLDFGAEWNESWTTDNYMHGTKYDPIMWDNSNLGSQPAPPTTWWQNAMGQEISVALKLEQKFLDAFKGQNIAAFETHARPGVKVTFMLMKSGAAVQNAGEFAEYIEEAYSKEEILWTSGETDPDATGWAKAAVSECVVPSDGNVFVVASIKGGGEWVNEQAEFQWTRQVLNRFTPTYVNFGNAEGRDLYRFVGGTAKINIHMQ